MRRKKNIYEDENTMSLFDYSDSDFTDDYATTKTAKNRLRKPVSETHKILTSETKKDSSAGVLDENYKSPEELEEELEEVLNDEAIMYGHDSKALESNLRGIGMVLNAIKSHEYDTLEKSEERKLFKVLQSHTSSPDEKAKAKKELINHNIRFVISIAKRVYKKNKTWDIEDLMQEGICGLDTAISKFSLAKGTKFVTYAHPWVRQAMTRALAEKSGIIRYPVNWQDGITKIRKAENQYCLENCCCVEEVPIQALIKITGLDEDKIKKYKEMSQAGSLDVVVDENSTTRGELIEDIMAVNPEKEYLEQEKRREIFKVLESTLDEKELFIIVNKWNLLYRDHIYTIDEVAEHFNLTCERIHQIEATALRKLRHPAKSTILRAYYMSMCESA